MATESAQLKENVNSPSNEVVVDEIILIGDGLNESKVKNKILMSDFLCFYFCFLF